MHPTWQTSIETTINLLATVHQVLCISPDKNILPKCLPMTPGKSNDFSATISVPDEKVKFDNHIDDASNDLKAY